MPCTTTIKALKEALVSQLVISLPIRACICSAAAAADPII
jgi:hypothetical protein